VGTALEGPRAELILSKSVASLRYIHENGKQIASYSSSKYHDIFERKKKSMKIAAAAYGLDAQKNNHNESRRMLLLILSLSPP
jgi:hypothetical protein